MRPSPLVPPDVDLRDFQFLAIDINRLFGSNFHANSTDAEWRAGMTLWLKSFHQVPAASIPAGDVALARLAEFGRDVSGWEAIKTGALHGWVLCSDDKHYHPVVAEKALEAWIAKLLQRRAGIVGNAKRWKIEADTNDVDCQLNEAASALQKLSPNSPSLRKWRPNACLPSDCSSPPDDHDDDGGSPSDLDSIAEGSQPDRDGIATLSQPDPNPIAGGSPGGSQEIGIGIGIKEKRESRAGATPPPVSAEQPKPTPKRGRSSKSLDPWPPDFELTAGLREYAQKHGFDADWLFEKFHNKALAVGWQYRDWPAAFRTFAQNERTYTTQGRPNGAHQAQAWRPPDV